MNMEMTPMVWAGLGIGLLFGVLLAFFAWRQMRILTLVLAGLAVAGGIVLAITVPDSGATIVTALLATSVGNVLANIVRAKSRNRNS
ncbi:MAG: hypothetical protein LBG99_04965 [Propionibacteriaceae bacterium]|jgi:ABC-type Mn2+/Zn2+ transport system permease subunit|nr:hypothetical protein [Propionibacteriaceae bacterium]